MAEKKEKQYVSDNAQLMAEWNWGKNNELSFDPQKLTCGSGKKVWWKCRKDHEWQATIASRTYGTKCPYCSGNKVLIGFNDLETTHPNLTKEWHHSKNRELTAQKFSAGSTKKVWWKCKHGHEWKARIDHRSNGSSCPYCSGNKVLTGFNDLMTTHPEIAKEWHPTKNKKTPQQVSVGSHQKVWWKCERGHEWEAKLYNRLKSRGCPYCWGETQTSFPEQAILYYFKKVTTAENRWTNLGKEIDVYLPKLQIGVEYNGQYWHKNKENTDAEKVEFFKNKGIRIITLMEGFENRINNDTIEYIYGEKLSLEWAIAELFKIVALPLPLIDISADTPQIYNQYIMIEKEKSLASIYPQLIKEWHPIKNGELTPYQISFGSAKKVWWLCEKGHEWQSDIQHRSTGKGCPFCSGRNAIVGETDLETISPSLAKQWHPTKNGKLSPKQISFGSSKKVWWLCEKGHEWQAKVNHRYNGSGCPYCSGNKVLVGYNDIETTHPELAKEWHYNNELTPQNFSSGSNKKVWWICSKCGYEWSAIIYNRSKGIGCPKCAIEKRNKSN